MVGAGYNNNNELGVQGEGIRMREVSIPEVNKIPREDDERSKKCRVFGVDIGGHTHTHTISNTHPPDSSNAGNQQSSPSYIKVTIYSTQLLLLLQLLLL